MKPLVSLTDQALGRGAVGRPTAFAVDGKGNVFVAYNEAPHEIVVHDPRTGEATRRLGRRGEGPGEFTRIQSLRIGPGDTLHAFDLSRRRNVFSPEGRFVRSTRLPAGGLSAVVLSQDRLILAASVASRTAIGYPLHAVSPSGEVLLSFGVDTPRFTPDMATQLMRMLAPAGQDAFVAGRFTEYRVEHWNDLGELRAVFLRNVPWFISYDAQLPLSSARPPQPAILSVRVDDQSRLWVVSRVGDPRWKSVIAKNDRPNVDGRVAPFRVTDYKKFYDTNVDVIDLASGRLIASRQFDEPFGLHAENGYYLLLEDDRSGTPHTRLFRLELQIPPSR